MATRVLLLLGTKKGAFIAESDAARRSWTLRGPYCETWPMNHVIADPRRPGAAAIPIADRLDPRLIVLGALTVNFGFWLAALAAFGLV